MNKLAIEFEKEINRLMCDLHADTIKGNIGAIPKRLEKLKKGMDIFNDLKSVWYAQLIIENYNFKAVHKILEERGEEWIFDDDGNEKGIPTVNEIILLVCKMLQKVKIWEEQGATKEKNFLLSKSDKTLCLSFILAPELSFMVKI